MARPQRLNVLVVDRDPATLLELKDFLSEEGYQVESLSEPDQVVEEVKNGRFQLILLDVSPPLDAGVELLQRMRAADSDVCVICMTAMATVEGAVRTLVQERLGALGITDPRQVGRLVGDVMKTHKGQVEAGDVKRIAEELLKS